MDNFKTTDYFAFTRQREDRKGITDEWILKAVNETVKESVQADGRIRRWAWIEAEGKFFRVILLEDAETVHNAFIDRQYHSEGTE